MMQIRTWMSFLCSFLYCMAKRLSKIKRSSVFLCEQSKKMHSCSLEFLPHARMSGDHNVGGKHWYHECHINKNLSDESKMPNVFFSDVNIIGHTVEGKYIPEIEIKQKTDHECLKTKTQLWNKTGH